MTVHFKPFLCPLCLLALRFSPRPLSLCWMVIINYCNGTEGKVTGGSLLILSSTINVCLSVNAAAPFLDLPLNLHTPERIWIFSKSTSTTPQVLYYLYNETPPV